MEKKEDPGAVAMVLKRAESMSPKRRSEIAAKAAAARWGKKAAPLRKANKAKGTEAREVKNTKI